MKHLPLMPLLVMFFLPGVPCLAQQESAPPSSDPATIELSAGLRRVANALERVLESQRTDTELKKIEVASRILQLHWEQITQLRNAAETAEKEAASAEQNQNVMLAELDILSAREHELRDSPESGDGSGERPDRLRQIKEERQKLESYIEQDKDRAWRRRDQANIYQAEVVEIRSKVAHLEAVIARWLDDLE